MIWTLLIIAVLWRLLDPWTRWRNSVIDRADAWEMDMQWVWMMDCCMILMIAIFTLGLIPSTWSSTFLSITDNMHLKNWWQQDLWWAGSAAICSMVTFMLVKLTQFLWKTIGFYAGRFLWGTASIVTKFLAGIAMYMTYSLIGTLLVSSLASILAISERKPNYEVIIGFCQLINICLFVNGLLTPLSEKEMTVIRRMFRLEATIRSDRALISEYRGNGVLPEFLPAITGPIDAYRRVEPRNASQMLKRLGRSAVRFSDRMFQDEQGDYFVQPRPGDRVEDGNVRLLPPRF